MPVTNFVGLKKMAAACQTAIPAWLGNLFDGLENDAETRRLIAYELQCIQELGFSAYFLITEDFVDYARSEGIDVGLGRGSAPGSVITYVLGITDVDPIHYGLSEGGIGLTRFLNPTVLYGLTLDGFGELPAAFAPGTFEVPASDAMEGEIADLIAAIEAAGGSVA